MPKTKGLDEASVELLESNRKDRDKMEEEIQELRARAVSKVQTLSIIVTTITNYLIIHRRLFADSFRIDIIIIPITKT